jgi:pseudaminic acid synthase
MIKIGSKIISSKNKPFVIAEMSGNHNGSLLNALKLIDLASKSGADAVKLQTFTPDTITMKSNRKEFFISDKKNLWKNYSLYNLYKKAHTPWEWHKKIFARAKKNKLICFSSPFDESAVDFLEKLKVPIYKIASFENTHFPLLKKIAQTGKPVIMSTGLASLAEISESVKFLRKNGCKKLALLKCTSSYPANPSDLNLLTIKDLQKKFKCEVGISDHTLGIGASIAAVGIGATIIEKHFTLKRNVGVDGKFSHNFFEMKQLVQQAEIAWKSLGKVAYGPTKDEKRYIMYRRSIYAFKDIKKGEKITKYNVKVIRPSLGLKPKFYWSILGKKIKKNIKRGEPLKSNHY